MHYIISTTPALIHNILSVLQREPSDKILDITAFGDIFIQTDNGIIFYNFTDGTISNVTDLIDEFGLPPVNLDLGDQWYQVSAQALLHENHFTLQANECFGFVVALNNDGVYGPENIKAVNLIDYYTQRLNDLVAE